MKGLHFKLFLLIALFIVCTISNPSIAQEKDVVVDEATPGAILIPNDDGDLYWWAPPILQPASEVMQMTSTELQTTPQISILNQTNAEVIFLMDTSGSMSDEFSTLCSRISYIVQELQNML